MKAIEITIDLSKIDKSRIVENEYTNKNGELIKQKNYKIVVVPLKEKKFVKDFGESTMYKTHFVKEKRKKDEPDNFIGDGFDFERKETQPVDAIDFDF